jgi:CRISPR/Cas system CMR-associated protein Cmr5 small subunit
MPEPSNADRKPSNVLRDQQRALDAYGLVGAITDREVQKDYKTALQQFGTALMKQGLAVAVSSLERRKGPSLLLQHLTMARLPVLTGLEADKVGDKIRELPVSDYRLVTRETVPFVNWLVKAVQAKFPDEDVSVSGDASLSTGAISDAQGS